MARVENSSRQPYQRPLLDLALLFLRLGTTALGGPAAHIAMMEDEVVRRRHWMTQQEFLDLLGTDIAPIALALLSGVILFYFRINSVWLIIGGQ